MKARYLAAAQSLGWLTELIETELIDQPDESYISLENIRGFVSARASDDEIRAVLTGLEEFGAVVGEADGWKLDLCRLLDTADYRAGVRDAVNAYSIRNVDQDNIRICAAIPLEVSESVSSSIRTKAVDLRAGILDIVSSAQLKIMLASPFWDEVTAEELVELLSRRLEAGVSVELLGRPEPAGGWPLIRTELGAHSACRVFEWDVPSKSDPFGSQTFHFKAAVSDNGARVYLGSANFTLSGLRSRMELGVLLSGKIAGKVAEVIDDVLMCARRVA